MTNKSINKWASITQKKDFAKLKKEGFYKKKKGFFVVYRNNGLSYARFAFVFPHWIGNAPQRSRFKRWARSFLREKSYPGLDLLLGFERSFKALYKNMSYEKFCSGFSALLPKNQNTL